MIGLQNHQRNNDKRESNFETVSDDIDSYIDDIDITGETRTREKRKMRSATQRAARRWWNTEAIDLEIYFNIIFIRTKSDHCLVLSLSQSVTLSALCEFCSNWICQSHVMLDGFVKIYECITLPGENFHDHWSRQISTLWWGQ